MTVLSTLLTFKPLSPEQIFVMRYCQGLVTYFISCFHHDWAAGLPALTTELKKGGGSFLNTNFSHPSVSEGLMETGGGYKATVTFTMSGTNQGTVTIQLTLESYFENGRCNVICGFEEVDEALYGELDEDVGGDDPSRFKEVFRSTLEFSESASEWAEKLKDLHGAQIFDGVNARLGLVGNLPRLTSIGIVIKGT